MDRRQFLKVSGLATSAALISPSVLTAATKTEDKDAIKWFAKVRHLYMSSNWPRFDEFIKAKESKTHIRKLRGVEKSEFSYMKIWRKKSVPHWWKNCGSEQKTSFIAHIWNRKFKINYIPSNTLGVQAARVNPSNGRLQIIVSWRPYYLGKMKFLTEEDLIALLGEAAPCIKNQKFTYNNMAATIAWHEMGHNYVTTSFREDVVMKLYTTHGKIFSHIQEFFADLTVLNHAPAGSKLFGMMFRVPSLFHYNHQECHARGCAHAVGALLLSHILKNPKKWPSFKFPSKWPKLDIEKFVIGYTYSQLRQKTWTMKEDAAMRKFVVNWSGKVGKRVFKDSGMIILDNKHKMHLLADKDYDLQIKRDKWIVKQLEKLRKKGKLDPPEEVDKHIAIWVKSGLSLSPRAKAYYKKLTESRNKKLKSAIRKASR